MPAEDSTVLYTVSAKDSTVSAKALSQHCVPVEDSTVLYTVSAEDSTVSAKALSQHCVPVEDNTVPQQQHLLACWWFTFTVWLMFQNVLKVSCKMRYTACFRMLNTLMFLCGPSRRGENYW